MLSLLSILDIGITVVVPAVVWAMIAVGLVQLIRESMHGDDISHRQVARQARS